MLSDISDLTLKGSFPGNMDIPWIGREKRLEISRHNDIAIEIQHHVVIPRFDWIQDVHLEAKFQPRASLYLTKQRDNPRTVFVKAARLGMFVREILPTLSGPVVLYKRKR